MSKHRANTPSITSVVSEVRNQMTDHEIIEAALALTVGNEAYTRKLSVAGRPVRLENRGSNARMGRFGGGWDFEVGIQLGRGGLQGTIIVNLGRGSIRIDARRIVTR